MMQSMTAIAAARAPHLVERIKIETRWLLFGIEPIDMADPDDRLQFVSAWPEIRNKRVPAHEIATNFYAIAADHGAALAALIKARRARYAGQTDLSNDQSRD